jgi:hypothetical protein
MRDPIEIIAWQMIRSMNLKELMESNMILIMMNPTLHVRYTVDELPDDMAFVEDKVYGDRRYEKGQIFYRNESNNDLYWRQCCRPRLKTVLLIDLDYYPVGMQTQK